MIISIFFDTVVEMVLDVIMSHLLWSANLIVHDHWTIFLVRYAILITFLDKICHYSVKKYLENIYPFKILNIWGTTG